MLFLSLFSLFPIILATGPRGHISFYDRQCKPLGNEWQHIFIIPWTDISEPVGMSEDVPAFVIPEAKLSDTQKLNTAFRTVYNLSLAFRLLFKPRFKYMEKCVECTDAFKIARGVSLVNHGMFRNDIYAINEAVNSPDYFYVNVENNASLSYHDIFGYDFSETLSNRFHGDLRFFTNIHDEIMADIKNQKPVENFKFAILTNSLVRLISYYDYNIKRDIRLPDKGKVILSLWEMVIPIELISVHRLMYLYHKITINFQSRKIRSHINEGWPNFYSNGLCSYVVSRNHLILYTRIPLTMVLNDKKTYHRTVTKFDYYTSAQPLSDLLQYSQVMNQFLQWVCLIFIYFALVRRRQISSPILRATTVVVIPEVEALPPQEMYYGTFAILSTVSILIFGILLVLFVSCCCKLPTYLISYFGRVLKTPSERSILNNYVLRLGIYLPYIRFLERHEQEIYIDMPLESTEPIPFNTKYIRLNGNLHLWVIRERGPSLRLECISLIEFEACRPDGQVISILKHCVSIPLNSIMWYKNNMPLGMNENESGLAVVELLVRKVNNESHYETPIGKTYVKTTEL